MLTIPAPALDPRDPIPFAAMCEHHALPFPGRALVGYVAREDIIGISTLTRLVRVVTRRFGARERTTAFLGAYGKQADLRRACYDLAGLRRSSR